MTTQEQCEAILRKIVELANTGKVVQFEEDWGSLTVNVDSAHTHVGTIAMADNPGSFEQLAEDLYNRLHGGPGLSWHDPQASEII